MTGDFPPKRIFEVARELRISTPELIDYLAGTGHDVTRKQMQPVNESMYIALLHKYDRPKFEQYLIAHGVVGDELRRLASFLDDQKKKAQKPAPPIPKPEPPKVTRPLVARNVRAPMEKSETIKVTFFRRERPAGLPAKPAAIPYVFPASIYSRVGQHPTSIATSPMALQLIKLVLALPNERKQMLISELRLVDPR